MTPEKAIVGTAAETARTSRGWWAMWFISALAPSWRASSTRRPMTSTRLRSRSSPRLSTARRAACEGGRHVGRRRPPRGRASPGRRGRARSRGRAPRPRGAGPRRRTGAASPARARRCSAAAASAVADSGRPSGSRGRATGWWPLTSRPSSSRRGSGATASSTSAARPSAWLRISGTAVDSHSSPRRSAPERPDRRVGATGRVERGGRRGCGSPCPAVAACASDTPPRAASRSSRSGSPRRRTSRAGPVQLTTQPTSWAEPSESVTRRPPPVSGDGVDHRAGRGAASRSAPASSRSTAAELGGMRWRSAVPVAGVGRAGTRRGPPRESRCHSSLTRKRRPSMAGRQSPPVARTRSTCSATPRRGARRAWLPQSSTSGMAASWSSSACGGRERAGAGHGEHPAVLAPARAGEGEDDVDHGEAGADEQHVARADAVAAYDVEGARRPRVGDEERRTGERRRRPVVPGGREPGGDHARRRRAGRARRRAARVAPPGARRTPTARGADVAQRGRGGGQVERVGERLLQVARELPAGREGRPARPRPRAPAGPARRRSARGPAGSAVMPAAGTLRRCSSSSGAEGRPAARPVRRVDDARRRRWCRAGGRCGRGGSRPGCRPRHPR